MYVMEGGGRREEEEDGVEEGERRGKISPSVLGRQR